MIARPYQERAVRRVLEEWEKVRATLLVQPTGTGKTIEFSLIARNIVRNGGRVLILAHRDELIRQAADKLRAATGLSCAIEKADEYAGRCLERVIVASVQTLLSPARRDSIWAPTHIIVDEAHHAISESYQAVLRHWPEAKVLGVTATPDRGDMRNLGSFFESLADEYTLPQAIAEGYLAPIKALTLPLKIDATGLQASGGGDYSKEAVATALDPYLPEIGRHLAEHCAGRKLMVFAPLRATARKVQDALTANGLNCYYADGEDRSEIAAFEAAGPGCAIANAMLLTEGYDHTAIDAVCVLRATKVRSLYAQMVGRGTRLHPGKDHLLLIDFLWLSRKHELCRPAHLFAEDEEVAQAMTEAAEREAGGVMDLDAAALTTAQQEVLEKREEALAKKLAEMRHRKRELVDALQYAVSIGAEGLVNYQPALKTEAAAPTATQINALEKAGIFPGDVTSAGHAEALLATMATRREAGLAEPRQVRCLEKYGYRHAGQLTYEFAQKLIRRIAANGWRLPENLKTAWKEQGVYAS